MTVQIKFHIRYYTDLYSAALIMMSANTPNNSTPSPDKQNKKENLWVNLAFNIAIPAIILSKFSNDEYLGITLGLVVALAFPFIYGVMDFFQRDKINVFSVLGVISTLLTGSISLLKLGPEYIAIKEAAIPGLIGLTVFISTWTRFPLVGKLIMNEAIFNLSKLNQDRKSTRLNSSHVRISYAVFCLKKKKKKKTIN